MNEDELKTLARDLTELKITVGIINTKQEELIKKLDNYMNRTPERCRNQDKRIEEIESDVEELKNCDNVACKNLVKRIDIVEEKGDSLKKWNIGIIVTLLLTIIGSLFQLIGLFK